MAAQVTRQGASEQCASPDESTHRRLYRSLAKLKRKKCELESEQVSRQNCPFTKKKNPGNRNVSNDTVTCNQQNSDGEKLYRTNDPVFQQKKKWKETKKGPR